MIPRTTTQPGACDNNPNERQSPEMTEINDAGQPADRYTEYSRYLLPNTEPREDVQFDSYGRYKLPSPTTGRPTSFTRATTVSSTTADHYMLGQWKIREKVMAVLKAQEFSTTLLSGDGDSMTDNQMAMACKYNELASSIGTAKARDINATIDIIHDFAGGADARELGTAVHDWLGELDMGRVLFHQLPDYIKPYATSYLSALREAGLVAVADYTERVVLNDRGKETVAGRIDRIYRRISTGELVLGDLKTSKSLDLAAMEYAIQFAVYGYATLMLDLNGTSWSPMPEIDQDTCVVLHVPSDKPEDAKAVAFDLYAGGEGMITALEVRTQRKVISKKAMAPTLATPTESAVRYVEARQAIQNITSADDAVAIREQYEDIWTDDLTEFGATCFDLIATDTDPERN